MQLSLLPTAAIVLEKAMTAAQEAYDKGAAENTLRVRKTQIKAFTQWLIDAGYTATTEPTTEIVALHVGWMLSEGYARSSIQQRINSIRLLCRERGLDDPTDSPTFRQLANGLRRVTSAPKGKDALSATQICRALEVGKFSVRERALLLIGAVTGLRVSDLCALTWQDCEMVEGGALLHVERSKTDQAGEGRSVFVPATGGKNCPFAALQLLPKIGSMFPIFGVEFSRDIREVRLLMKRVAEAAGLNPDNISAHSLRKSMATIADRQDVGIQDIQHALWHTKLETTQVYIAKNLVAKNPAFRAVAEALG